MESKMTKERDAVSVKTQDTLPPGTSTPALELTNILQEQQSFRRPKTQLERLLASMTGEDFFMMKCAIVTFPLMFREPPAEARYRQHVALALQSQMMLSGALSCISVICLCICIGVCLARSYLVLTHKVLLVAFWSGQGIAIAGSALVTLAPLVQRVRPYIESILNVAFVTVSLALVASFLRIAIDIFQAPTVLTAMLLKLFVDTCVFGLAAYTLLTFSCVFSTRTRYSIFINTGLALLVVSLYIVEAFLIVKVTPQTYKLGDKVYTEYHVASFVTVITLTQCAILVSLSLFSTGARYFNEMHQRVVFYRWLKSEERVVQMQARSKVKANGTTAIEDLIQYIETSIQLIGASGLVETKPVLDVALKILHSSMQKLTKADRLFAINVKRSVARTTTQEGGDNMEERFYGMYANVTQDTEQTHTRIPSTRAPLSAAIVRGPHRETQSRRQSVISASLLSAPKSGTTSDKASSEAAFVLRDISVKLDSVMLRQLENRIGCDWTLNLPMLAETASNILLHVGMSLLLRTSVFISDAEIIPLARFLAAIEELYQPNPYHNALHGAMVAHSTMAIANILNILTNNNFEEPYGLLTVTLIIAALCHDVGHPGRNNVFFRNSGDSIAILYNDNSILENFHACVTFEVLARKDTGILDHLEPQELRRMRQRMVELILSTDMGSHFDSISKFRVRRRSSEFDYFNDLEDFWLVLRMCIKAADLSHALVDWYQHVDWSLRVAEEFYQQGKHEANMFLPVSPLCDRGTHGDFAKSQKGFIEFVVQPLIKEIEELDAGDDFSFECSRSMLYNKFKWEEMAASGQTVPIPDNIRSRPTMKITPAKVLQREVFKAMHNLETKINVGQLPSEILQGTSAPHTDEEETSNTGALDSAAWEGSFGPTDENFAPVDDSFVPLSESVDEKNKSEEQEAEALQAEESDGYEDLEEEEYVEEEPIDGDDEEAAPYEPPETVHESEIGEDEIQKSTEDVPSTFSSDEEKLERLQQGVSFVSVKQSKPKQRNSVDTSASSSVRQHDARLEAQGDSTTQGTDATPALTKTFSASRDSEPSLDSHHPYAELAETLEQSYDQKHIFSGRGSEQTPATDISIAHKQTPDAAFSQLIECQLRDDP